MVGCRSTDSAHHAKLRPPVSVRKDASVLTKKTDIREGFKYIYGHFQPYAIVDGRVKMEDVTLPLTGSDLSENERTFEMIYSLNTYLVMLLKFMGLVKISIITVP